MDSNEEQAFNEISYTLRGNARKLRWTILLLMLIIGCLAGFIPKTEHVLTLSLETELEDNNRSDRTQVQAALKHGGMIRLKFDADNRSLLYSLGDDYQYYGAGDSGNQFWVIGAF